MKASATFENLGAFLADLEKARRELEPRLADELAETLEDVTSPLAERYAPRARGRLRASRFVKRIGNAVWIGFRAPYALGAERGVKGKWKGFAKYGTRGNRYLGRAAKETLSEVTTRVATRMRGVFGFGWFR